MRGSSLLMLAVLASCAPAETGLTVDVRTDLVPGTDFVTVQTEVSHTPFTSLSAMGMVAPHAVHASDDFLMGQRVDELPALAPGDYYVRVSLLNTASTPLLQRTTVLTLASRYALTVILAEACRGVVCPRTGDRPTATECSGGDCVDPHCSPEASGSCGLATCRADVDCHVSDCGRAVCASGTCLVEPRVCPSDAGAIDASQTIDVGQTIDAYRDDAAACGGVGQTCCAGGGCNAGATCASGSCVACGNPGQPCCAGACGGGQVCSSGTCQLCGNQSQLCCGGGGCTPGLVCYLGAVCTCVGYASNCAGGETCCGPYVCGGTSAGTICCGNEGDHCDDGDSSHCCGSLLCCNDGSNFVCVPPGSFPGC